MGKFRGTRALRVADLANMRAAGSWSVYGCAALLALSTLFAAASCANDDTGGASGGEAGAPPEGGSPGRDAADAGAPPGSDASVVDGSGKQGAECSFNRECMAALRCECTVASGCACKPGPRGTGRNGLDPCDAGEACQSSVCVEGPTGTGSFCTGECKTEADCTGKLPVCADNALVGRICIRKP